MKESVSESDLDLLELWRSRRDPDAFHELVSRHAGMVHATCRRILGNEADAEDVAQECFFALARDDAGVERSIAGWLHRLATHRSLDLKRRDLRRRERERRSAEAAAERAPDTAWQSIQALVDEAIEGLPEDERRLVIGHFLEREPYEVLARRHGMTRWMVAYRVQLAVKAIRRRLKRQGIAVSGAVLGALFAAHAEGAAPATLLATLGKLALAGTPGPAAAGPPGPFPTPDLAAAGRWMMPRLGTAFAIVAGCAFLGILAWRSGAWRPPSPPATARLAAVDRTADRSGTEAAAVPRLDAAPQSPFAVRVVWADTREPVAGAAVRLASLDEVGAAVREAPTDGRGAAAILHPSTWTRARIEVRHPRSGVHNFEVALPAEETIECELPQGIVVTGRLVENVAGPGAERLTAPASGGGVLLQPHPRRGRPDESPPPEKAVTGEDGRFTFAGIPRGYWFQLEVDATGRALRVFSFRWAEPRGRSVLDCGDILVESGADLVLDISGPDGERVASAQVLVKRETDPRFTSAGLYESHREGVEVEPGRYSVARLLVGAPRIQVVAAGYARFREYVHVPPGGEPVPIRLERGQVLAGEATSENGVPLADVALEIDGPRLGLPLPATRSDGQGRFRFDVLSDGEYTVRARADGHAALSRRGLRPGMDPVAIVLVPESVYAGRVVDEDGRPLPSAEVSLAGRGDTFRAATDPRGCFALRGLAAGTFHVTADHQELAPRDLEPIALQKGETLAAGDLVLARGRTVRGMVVDAATGLGVGGAPVILILLDAAGQATRARRLADTLLDGSFAIRGVAEGEHRMVVKARGYLIGGRARLRIGPAGSDGDVRLALEPGSSIAGTVRDGNGKPVDRASVRVSCPLLAGEDWSDLEALLKAAAAQTDRDGAFTLRGLPPREGYRLVVDHPDHAPGVASGIVLAPRAALVGIRVTLPRGGAVRGRITDGEGRGITGARVIASRQAPAGDPDPIRDESITTGADGGYQLSRLCAGTWSLLACAPGRLPARIPAVRVGEGGVTGGVQLVLDPGESLSGRVVDEEGRGVAGARVQATAAGPGLPESGLTDASGRFAVRGLLAGAVALEIVKPGFVRETAEVLVPARDELTVALRKAAWIRGRVRGAPEVPLQRLFVIAHSLTSPGRAAGEPAPLDSDGGFALEVPPGAYLVTAAAAGPGPALPGAIPVQATAGETAGGVLLDLDLPTDVKPARVIGEPDRTVRLRGFVSAEGAPLSEGSIAAAADGEIHARGRVDAFGGYQLELPAGGRYQVMVSLRDGVGARCEVTVPPGVAEFRRDLETPAAEVAPLLVPVDE